ncbi:MAG: porin [Candidatus Desulfaltia sp.]|nr:porin [Candidatus Desulfaltia sp.]
MKKFTIAALAVCLAFALAAPAMAVDADFTGAYRVRGSYVEHYDLLDTSPSHDYMDMRLRLQTVFKASDILSVTMRLDALDNKRWGDADTANTGAGNIDLDRVFMTIKAPIGKFDIGRMAGGTFGTTFVDSDSDYDRIKYTKVIDNLTLLAIYQKNAEKDYTTPIASGDGTVDSPYVYRDAADQDSETYYLAPIYKMENVTAGVLFGFTNNKVTADADAKSYLADPYFVAKFGPLAIQGELFYKWGTTEYDSTAADKDLKALAYNLEASYSFGPASVMLGYAFASGQDPNDTDTTGFGGVGNDWEKLFILTTNEVADLSGLGGVGNVSNDGIKKIKVAGYTDPGAKIIYGGVSFSPLDNLKLGLAVGYATADQLPAGATQDDAGTEYDLTLNWKIYDNLTYTAIAAFLDAGDLYKQAVGNDTHFDDTYALFHQLQLTF